MKSKVIWIWLSFIQIVTSLHNLCLYNEKLEKVKTNPLMSKNLLFLEQETILKTINEFNLKLNKGMSQIIGLKRYSDEVHGTKIRYLEFEFMDQPFWF